MRIDITFTTPFLLGPDHVFFRPEVDLGTAGNFLWLSAPKPIIAPGTPFAADLQSWIRNDGAGALAPDWECAVWGRAGWAGASAAKHASWPMRSLTTTGAPRPRVFPPGSAVAQRVPSARRSTAAAARDGPGLPRPRSFRGGTLTAS